MGLVGFLCVFALVCYGQMLRSRLAGIDKGLAVIAGVLTLWNLIYFALTGAWDESLPLQVCDWMPAITAWAWWSNDKRANALLFFIGIVLCTQAFVTPIVAENASWQRVVLFWCGHGVIIWAAMDKLIAGYQPIKQDYMYAWYAMALYIAAMFLLDFATGWNYGYVGPSNPQAAKTVLDILPVWPWRVLWMAIIVSVVWIAWAYIYCFIRRLYVCYICV